MIGLEGSSERDGNAVGDAGRDAVDTKASLSRLYAPLPAGTRPLNVVVLVDRLDVPAWVGETIAEITACDAAELVAVVAIAAETPPRYSCLNIILSGYHARGTLCGWNRVWMRGKLF